MVVGLEIFTEHFKEFTRHYILIGGSACDRHFDKRGVAFRATKDLDIILIVEALTDAFVTHFWQFIKDGEYVLAQKGSNRQFYRFIAPKTQFYPYMIELFSRKPDPIREMEGMYLTDIPTSEEVSSLSAILLDDDYYHFTLAHTAIYEGLHHASEIALIVLKAKAFLNNRQREAEGQKVQQDDIVKHRKDVIRLTAILPPEIRVDCPAVIKTDLRSFIEILQQEQPDVKALLKNLGITGVTLEQVIDQIEQTFGLVSQKA